MTDSISRNIDDINSTTTPYYYTQDLSSYLANYNIEGLNVNEGEKSLDKSECCKSTQKSARKSLKKTSASTSYVIRKTSRKGRNLIKIDIQPMNNSESDNSVSVQYIVENAYDEIMDATETVINKIVKRISESGL